MRVLVDTNVVLDVLLDRAPFARTASQVFAQIEKSQVEASLCATTITTIVTGRSMGGFATWDAIARRLDFFAAAVPIAGGGDPQCASEWKDLPIWAFASAGDRTCPVSGTRKVVEALKKAGGNIR